MNADENFLLSVFIITGKFIRFFNLTSGPNFGEYYIFILKIYCLGTIELYDGKIKLEEQLPNILATIEYKAFELSNIWAKNDRKRQIEAEKLRIENEKKARKELEIQNFKNLLKESNAWYQSIILVNYLKEKEKSAIENNSLNEDFKQWLNWAKQKVDWYNPFIKKEDDILSDTDRLLF